MDKRLPGAPWWVYPALAGILFLAGLTLGWRLHAPRPAPAETYAASAVQADGSLILERKPDASASAPMQIPAGAKVQRLIQLQIKARPATGPAASSAPKSPAAPDQSLPTQAVNCQPLTLDLALVDQPDHTQRVIASSPDGLILGGLDIPVAPRPATRDPPRWAAGLSYDSAQRSGLWLERDLGALRTGIAVRQDDSGGLRSELRAGIRF